MNVQTIELDLAKRTGRQQQVTIAQGDAAGTTIVATIYDNGTKLAETGVTAKFLIGLPDNRHYMRDDATYEDGVITYVCDESRIASVHGYTDNAYFELHKGDTVASTERFSVIIEQCAYDGMDEGETYDTEIEQALRAMATAIGAVSDAVEMAEGAVSDATTAVTEAQQAVATANTVTQQAQAAVADAEAATTAANEAAETATEAAETITEANLPHVSVGAANGITGEATDSAAWLQRVSTADGPTTVKSIHGRTLRWNQLIKDHADYSRTESSQPVMFSYTQGTYEVTTTITGEVTAIVDLNTGASGLNWTGIQLYAGHKYMLKGAYNGNEKVALYVVRGGNVIYSNEIFTNTADGNAAIRVRVFAGIPAGTYKTRVQLFDLTAMFGAGNEPSTVAEFEALYPLPYYEYDAGSLLPVRMTGIETTGFNQWDEEWETGRVDPSTGRNTSSTANIRSKNLIPVLPSANYVLTNTRISTSWDVVAYDANGTYIKYLKWGGSVNKRTAITTPDNCHYLRFSTNAVSGGGGYGNTYQHDICLNLSDPNRNGEYAPYWQQTRPIPAGTLRGTSTEYDELTETVRTTCIGVYTLTSDKVLGVSTNSNGHTRARIEGASDARAVNAAASGDTRFQLASDPTMYFSSNGYNYGNPGCFNIATGNNGFITLETSITTLEQAKAWVQAREPITIYYPLATPTVTPIDPPLNMTYRAAIGGTERILVPTGENSAPPTIVAAQGYTADSLRDAALSAIAPVENGLASANYGVGSYLVHAGQLCKVTTAIATGETITIGTNVTATTVMAEVIALIAQ